MDDQFGYVREAFSGDPSQQNLQRDRYRVLWDTYAAGRLDREQFGVNAEKQRLERSFGRVFANYTAGTDPSVFADIFDAGSWTHRTFMDWAREPVLLPVSSPDATPVAVKTSCA